MIPHKVTFHKCIPLQRGLGLDTVVLDFDKFEKGLVLIQGPLGVGKSSILSQISPYPDYPLPDGKIGMFNRIYEKDGYKDIELTFQDKHYRCQIYGNKEARLFEDDTLINKTSSISEYEKAVLDKFGDRDFYFKMMFSGGEMKEISNLTKGERKDLIINHISPHLKQYEILGKIFKEKIDETNNQLLILRDKLLEEDNIKHLRGVFYNEAKEFLSQIKDKEKEIEKEKKDLLNSEKEFTLKEKELEKYYKVEQKRNKIDLKYSNINTVSERIKINKDSKEKIETELLLVNSQKKDIDKKILEYKEDILSKSSIQKESKLKQQIKDNEKKISDNDINKERNEELIKKSLSLGNKIRLFKEKNHPCLFLLEQQQESLIKEQNSLNVITTKEILDIERDIEDCNLELEAIGTSKEASIHLEHKEKELSDLISLESNFQKRFDNLCTSIKKDIKILTSLEKKYKHEFKSLKLPENKINQLKHDKEEWSSDIIQRREIISFKKEELQDLTINYELKKKDYNTQKEKLESIDNLKVDEQRLIKVIDSYYQLSKFCSKEGYIVYELQDIGKRISDVCNNELLPYYEAKDFKIEFDTLRNGREVYDVLVSINGEEGQELVTCSRGERVCNNLAIKEAMNYVREEKLYKSFFIDEIDGSINRDSRTDFLKMLKRSHKLNNRHFTFLISHSQEIISQTYQQIVLEHKKVSFIY